MMTRMPEIGSKREVLGGRAGRPVLGTVVSARPYKSAWHWHPNGEWRWSGWLVETSVPEMGRATYSDFFGEREWRDGHG